MIDLSAHVNANRALAIYDRILFYFTTLTTWRYQYSLSEILKCQGRWIMHDNDPEGVSDVLYFAIIKYRKQDIFIELFVTFHENCFIIVWLISEKLA